MPSHPLSARNRDVLAAASRGLTARETGEALHIAIGTVKAHRAQAVRRLGARSMTHAVAVALTADLIPGVPA